MPIALDTETPKFDDKEPWRGNVYGDDRPIVCWSWAEGPNYDAKMWDAHGVEDVQALVDDELVVFFNGKHDVAYLRREGVDFSNVKVWDVQLGEFVLSRQTHKFPSLNETCVKYGLPVKLDVVKTEYWDKGIDTDQVPHDILLPYAAYDSHLTLLCYHEQLKHMTPRQKVLVSLMSQDMLILQEMESNGLHFNEEICLEQSKQLDDEASKITEALKSVYPDVPINFGSGDQLSAFLYGGTIAEDSKEFVGYFKSGQKAGQPKYKNITIEHKLPRLFEPLKNSAREKEGFYETNEPTLRKLKGKRKDLLDLILQLSKIDKLNGTYYKGLPALREKMRWEKGVLHGQFNQTLAGTGRLSASKPNQQNFATDIQNIFESQFE